MSLSDIVIPPPGPIRERQTVEAGSRLQAFGGGLTGQATAKENASRPAAPEKPPMPAPLVWPPHMFPPANASSIAPFKALDNLTNDRWIPVMEWRSPTSARLTRFSCVADTTVAVIQIRLNIRGLARILGVSKSNKSADIDLFDTLGAGESVLIEAFCSRPVTGLFVQLSGWSWPN